MEGDLSLRNEALKVGALGPQLLIKGIYISKGKEESNKEEANDHEPIKWCSASSLSYGAQL